MRGSAAVKVVIQNELNENVVGTFELKRDDTYEVEKVAPIITITRTGGPSISTSHSNTLVENVLNGRERPVVLILHGYLGHKDYLHQRLLAKCLPFPSFRFDFRGNGESTYPQRKNDPFIYFKEDVRDLNLVIDTLLSCRWNVYAIVSHSWAVPVALHVVVTRPNVIRAIVNIAGRFSNMSGYCKMYPGIEKAIDEDGKYKTINTLKRGHDEMLQLSRQTLEVWKEWDILMQTKILLLPKSVAVLTIHGNDDELISVNDALQFGRVIQNHTLVIINGGNHVFSNKQQELVEIIISWLNNNACNINTHNSRL
ncbi:Alpha/Beta hydrolase protein [Cladochytrium replicatum]|nr:Alpha/Beta hydrolase protein [Cladochytrium replicatum]